MKFPSGRLLSFASLIGSSKYLCTFSLFVFGASFSCLFPSDFSNSFGFFMWSHSVGSEWLPSSVVQHPELPAQYPLLVWPSQSQRFSDYLHTILLPGHCKRFWQNFSFFSLVCRCNFFLLTIRCFVVFFRNASALVSNFFLNSKTSRSRVSVRFSFPPSLPIVPWLNPQWMVHLSFVIRVYCVAYNVESVPVERSVRSWHILPLLTTFSMFATSPFVLPSYSGVILFFLRPKVLRYDHL